MSWLGSITDSVDMNFSKFSEIVEDGEAWHGAVRQDLATERQNGPREADEF